MLQLLVAGFLVLASMASILASIACIKYLVEHRDKHAPELSPEPCEKNEDIVYLPHDFREEQELQDVQLLQDFEEEARLSRGIMRAIEVHLLFTEI